MLKRCSNGAWAEAGAIWPSRLDSRDLTPDMVHEGAGDRDNGLDCWVPVELLQMYQTES